MPETKQYITIIDFDLPSTQERLWVYDVANDSILLSTHVAHGRNTGVKKAEVFSNKPNSYQSSLGFYLTGETYRGKNGYSLRLDGLEKGVNDNARASMETDKLKLTKGIVPGNLNKRASLSISRSPLVKDDDEYDEEDDWMLEFMGGGDGDSGAAADAGLAELEAAPTRDLSTSKALVDDEDPFSTDDGETKK